MLKSGLRAALVVATLSTTSLAAQQVDSVARDTSRVTTLETIEVTSSIAPTAGPGIGSGIPARISIVTGEAIDACTAGSPATHAPNSHDTATNDRLVASHHHRAR